MADLSAIIASLQAGGSAAPAAEDRTDDGISALLSQLGGIGPGPKRKEKHKTTPWGVLGRILEDTVAVPQHVVSGVGSTLGRTVGQLAGADYGKHKYLYVENPDGTRQSVDEQGRPITEAEQHASDKGFALTPDEVAGSIFDPNERLSGHDVLMGNAEKGVSRGLYGERGLISERTPGKLSQIILGLSIDAASDPLNLISPAGKVHGAAEAADAVAKGGAALVARTAGRELGAGGIERLLAGDLKDLAMLEPERAAEVRKILDETQQATRAVAERGPSALSADQIRRFGGGTLEKGTEIKLPGYAKNGKRIRVTSGEGALSSLSRGKHGLSTWAKDFMLGKEGSPNAFAKSFTEPLTKNLTRHGEYNAIMAKRFRATYMAQANALDKKFGDMIEEAIKGHSTDEVRAAFNAIDDGVPSTDPNVDALAKKISAANEYIGERLNEGGVLGREQYDEHGNVIKKSRQMEAGKYVPHPIRQETNDVMRLAGLWPEPEAMPAAARGFNENRRTFYNPETRDWKIGFDTKDPLTGEVKTEMLVGQAETRAEAEKAAGAQVAERLKARAEADPSGPVAQFLAENPHVQDMIEEGTYPMFHEPVEALGHMAKTAARRIAQARAGQAAWSAGLEGAEVGAILDPRFMRGETREATLAAMEAHSPEGLEAQRAAAEAQQGVADTQQQVADIAGRAAGPEAPPEGGVPSAPEPGPSAPDGGLGAQRAEAAAELEDVIGPEAAAEQATLGRRVRKVRDSLPRPSREQPIRMYERKGGYWTQSDGASVTGTGRYVDLNTQEYLTAASRSSRDPLGTGFKFAEEDAAIPARAKDIPPLKEQSAEVVSAAGKKASERIDSGEAAYDHVGSNWAPSEYSDAVDAVVEALERQNLTAAERRSLAQVDELRQNNAFHPDVEYVLEEQATSGDFQHMSAAEARLAEQLDDELAQMAHKYLGAKNRYEPVSPLKGAVEKLPKAERGTTLYRGQPTPGQNGPSWTENLARAESYGPHVQELQVSPEDMPIVRNSTEAATAAGLHQPTEGDYFLDEQNYPELAELAQSASVRGKPEYSAAQEATDAEAAIAALEARTTGTGNNVAQDLGGPLPSGAPGSPSKPLDPNVDLGAHAQAAPAAPHHEAADSPLRQLLRKAAEIDASIDRARTALTPGAGGFDAGAERATESLTGMRQAAADLHIFGSARMSVPELKAALKAEIEQFDANAATHAAQVEGRAAEEAHNLGLRAEIKDRTQGEYEGLRSNKVDYEGRRQALADIKQARANIKAVEEEIGKAERRLEAIKQTGGERPIGPRNRPIAYLDRLIAGERPGPYLDRLKAIKAEFADHGDPLRTELSTLIAQRDELARGLEATRQTNIEDATRQLAERADPMDPRTLQDRLGSDFGDEGDFVGLDESETATPRAVNLDAEAIPLDQSALPEYMAGGAAPDVVGPRGESTFNERMGTLEPQNPEFMERTSGDPKKKYLPPNVPANTKASLDAAVEDQLARLDRKIERLQSTGTPPESGGPITNREIVEGQIEGLKAKAAAHQQELADAKNAYEGAKGTKVKRSFATNEVTPESALDEAYTRLQRAADKVDVGEIIEPHKEDSVRYSTAPYKERPGVYPEKIGTTSNVAHQLRPEVAQAHAEIIRNQWKAIASTYDAHASAAEGFANWQDILDGKIPQSAKRDLVAQVDSQIDQVGMARNNPQGATAVADQVLEQTAAEVRMPNEIIRTPVVESAKRASDEVVQALEMLKRATVANNQALAETANLRILAAHLGHQADLNGASAAATLDAWERALADPVIQGKISTVLQRGAINYNKYAMPAPGVLLPRDVADNIMTFERYVPSENKFFEQMRKAIKYMRAWQITTPGFHIRNMFGGMWNNALHGTDTESYSLLIKLMNHEAGRGGPLTSEEARIWKELTSVVGPAGQIGSEKLRDPIARLAGEAPSSKMPWSVKGPIVRGSYAAGENVEFFLRASLGVDVLRKGGNVDDVVQAINKYHFNYADLSAKEQFIKQNVAPFFTWTRHNVPLQVQQLIDNPKMFNRFLQVKENVEAVSDPEKGEVIPGFAANSLLIRLPFMGGGGHKFYSPDLPIRDLNLLAAPLDALGGGGTTGDKAVEALSGVISQTAPILSGPIEWYLGKQVFHGIPLADNKGTALSALHLPDWMGKPLQLAGVANNDPISGKPYITSRNLYLINKLMPLFARAQVLTGSGDQKVKDSQTARLISFFLGTQIVTNDKKQQKATNYVNSLEHKRMMSVARSLRGQ